MAVKTLPLQKKFWVYYARLSWDIHNQTVEEVRPGSHWFWGWDRPSAFAAAYRWLQANGKRVGDGLSQPLTLREKRRARLLGVPASAFQSGGHGCWAITGIEEDLMVALPGGPLQPRNQYMG